MKKRKKQIIAVQSTGTGSWLLSLIRIYKLSDGVKSSKTEILGSTHSIMQSMIIGVHIFAILCNVTEM